MTSPGSILVSPKVRVATAALLGILAWGAALGEVTHEEQVASEVSEGLNLSAGVAAALTEFFLQHDRFPNDNQEAGIIEPNSIRGRFVNSVSVGPGNGVITIEYGNYADPILSGSTLTLKPQVGESRPIWTCFSEYIPQRYFPKKCRI